MKPEIIAPCARGKTEVQLKTPFDELLMLIHRVDNNALRDAFIRWISVNVGMEAAQRRFHRTELSRFTHAERDKAISKTIRLMAHEIGASIAKSGQIEIIQVVDDPWFLVNGQFRYVKGKFEA